MSDATANNRALFDIYQRNLQKLEEQRAMLGIDVPPALVSQIEDIRNELIRLESEHDALTVAHAPGSPQTLKPLELSLQKYDSFIIKFAREFEEWNGAAL